MGSNLEVNIVGPDYPIVNLCIPYKYPQEEYSIMGVYIYSGASVLHFSDWYANGILSVLGYLAYS